MPSPLVAMAGTGSDADYVVRAFESAAHRAGRELVALQPGADLVDDYVRALDAAAVEYGPILVGGVSIGASIATAWATRAGPERCVGVWAALPPWSGSPAGSPAAASASATADAMERDGLSTTIETMAAGSPRWLADELTRSWTALYPGVIGQLRAAAGLVGPDPSLLAGLAVPLAVVVSDDDPIHPAAVGLQWAAAAPRAAVRRTTLDQWGHEPAVLGRLAAQAWADAVAR